MNYELAVSFVLLHYQWMYVRVLADCLYSQGVGCTCSLDLRAG